MNVFLQHTDRHFQGASSMCQVVSNSCLVNVASQKISLVKSIKVCSVGCLDFSSPHIFEGMRDCSQSMFKLLAVCVSKSGLEFRVKTFQTIRD